MTESVTWLETLDLYGPSNCDGLGPDQAVELEKRMYEAALLSSKEGYRRLSELKVPASRRLDYLAEMLKDDRTMTKIRANLVTAQQRIEAVESRKKKQAQRKFGKQLKAAKIEERKQKKLADKLSKPEHKPIEKENQRRDTVKSKGGSKQRTSKFKFGNKNQQKGAGNKKGGFKGPKGIKKGNKARAGKRRN
jgi:rRNA-processing protein EBP2